MDNVTNERKLQSWDDFIELAEWLTSGQNVKHPGAFRGHADARWRLEPTLLRSFRAAKVTEEEALELEQRALTLFQESAHLYADEETLSALTETVSWWSLMQHHGAPTRLLDWSVSIYVATYFAVCDRPECDGALWIVHKGLVEKLMEQSCEALKVPATARRLPATVRDVRPFFCQLGAPPVVYFFSRRRPDVRINAQEGLFSVCRNVLVDHEGILGGTTFQELSNLFRKYIVPAGLKPEFLDQLRSKSVTAQDLFPGLDGLGRSVREMIACSARNNEV